MSSIVYGKNDGWKIQIFFVYKKVLVTPISPNSAGTLCRQKL